MGFITHQLYDVKSIHNMASYVGNNFGQADHDKLVMLPPSLSVVRLLAKAMLLTASEAWLIIASCCIRLHTCPCRPGCRDDGAVPFLCHRLTTRSALIQTISRHRTCWKRCEHTSRRYDYNAVPLVAACQVPALALFQGYPPFSS